jgi:hypothetical protein
LVSGDWSAGVGVLDRSRMPERSSMIAEREE